ncbi:hypothetical protein GGX14DRAFT_564459 [Mycena pura]|uniref:Uncharacterized protein n=1 Tax=Mycena pura TaxID=153505 RepID=A0AAD6VH78_9AGAR|nr:hypothetical protein GGX14DRAFT_564459 [Mycena pura]
MATILLLSAADVRPLPEAIFGDPIRQRGGKGTMLKKRPKSGAGAGNPAAVNEGLQLACLCIFRDFFIELVVNGVVERLGVPRRSHEQRLYDTRI